MKKTNKNSSRGCEEVEHLLVKKDVDGLTPEENLLLEDHLKWCERCRSYQNALSNVRNSVQIDSEEKLIPDPAICQSIIRRMRIVKPEEIGIVQSAWQRIRDILAYRMPVYQTLAAVALIFLISVGINQLFITADRETVEPQGFAQQQTSTLAQMSVIDNLEIVDRQKIGRTVKEDPTLTRFIVTTR